MLRRAARFCPCLGTTAPRVAWPAFAAIPRTPAAVAVPLNALRDARRCVASGFDSDASAPFPAPMFPRPTLEHPYAGTPDDRGGVVVGSTSAGVRDNLPYAYKRANFIGGYNPHLRCRSGAGDFLALIDIGTGRAATAFMLAETNVLGTFPAIKGMSMATVSFNSFTFPRPVYEGDLAIVTSKVISTGGSSLAVHAYLERQASDSPVPSYVGEAYVTFVVVDAADITRPVRGAIPAVRLTIQVDIERNAIYHRLRQQNKKAKEMTTPAKVQARAPPLLDEVELEINKTKPRKVRIRDTTTLAHHHFLVSDVNRNKVIFGGEILRMMERAALHCGRVFAQTPSLFTLAMLGMTFDAPILLSEVALCRARVLCVKRSTMLVRVEITTENANGRRMTNSADFVLVSVTGERGAPCEIACGIELATAPPEELRWYARARALLEESAKNRVSLEEATARAAAAARAEEHAKQQAEDGDGDWD